MNENFSLQSSLEANYLNIQLNEPVKLDEIAVSVIKEDCPDFIIPFRLVNINDSISLKYKLINTIALEYANTTLHKMEFIKLYMILLSPFIRCGDWFLDYHNFCIDSRYIFLDKMSDAAYFIYVPEYSYKNTDAQIFEFFRNVFTRMAITDDAGFQVRLYQFFSKSNVTLTDLYDLLLQESRNMSASTQPLTALPNGVRPIQTVRHEEVRQVPPARTQARPEPPGPVPPKPEQVRPKAEAPIILSGQETDDEVVKALFGDNKKKGKTKKTETAAWQSQEKKNGGFSFFGKKKEGKPTNHIADAAQQISPPKRETIQSVPVEPAADSRIKFAQMQDTEDRTEKVSDDYQPATAYLELIDSPVPGAIQRIYLNFQTPYITIGRMSSDEIQPDVAFSREFSRIGRRHARIENRDGIYYIIDLGSANHTFLNGKPLVPNQAYQLIDGGEVSFTESKPVHYRIHL